MKKRSSFVANSSSSSFLLFGKETYIPDIKEFVEGKYICVGRWMCDGRDIFPLTQEIYNYCKSGEYAYETYHEKICNGYWPILIFEDYIEISENDNIDTTKLYYKYNGEIISFSSDEKDYHSTETLDDFIRNYIGD